MMQIVIALGENACHLRKVCFDYVWRICGTGCMMQAPDTCPEAWRKYWLGFEKMWYLVPRYISPLGTW